MHKVPERSYVSFLLSPHHNIIGLPGWSVPGSGSGHAAYWRPLETRWMPAGKWARTKEPNLNNAGTLTLLGMCLVHVSSRISAFVTVLVQNVRFIFLQWLDFLTGRLAGMSKTTKIKGNPLKRLCRLVWIWNNLTLSRSLWKSWPSFSPSRLLMNCAHDILFPTFC